MKDHLPKVGKRIDSYTSPYTMTKDSYFVMDKIKDNVAVFAGGSGRAFKFGPLLGDWYVEAIVVVKSCFVLVENSLTDTSLTDNFNLLSFQIA